jgi:hypothetical protein
MTFATQIENKIDCPRCGGSGETEHTHVVYGICFMCKGEGMVYPKRAEELTEKAKIRKANKLAKREAVAAQELIDSKLKQEKRESEIYAKNLEYFNAQKEICTKGSEDLVSKINSFAKLVLTESSSEEEVREFLNDYFKERAFDFRYQVSKWTLENYNFCFVKIYRDYDMTIG